MSSLEEPVQSVKRKEEHQVSPMPDSIEWRNATPKAGPTSGIVAPKRQSGRHRLASRLSGSARETEKVGSGTGTGAPVPVATLFLLCLLSEAHRGEGLGIPSPLPGCHFWRSCSVSSCCLRSTVWCALLGLTADTVHASVVGAFGCYVTHFRVKVDLGS